MEQLLDVVWGTIYFLAPLAVVGGVIDLYGRVSRRGSLGDAIKIACPQMRWPEPPRWPNSLAPHRVWESNVGTPGTYNFEKGRKKEDES